MQERQALIEELTNNLKTSRGDLTAVCKVYAIAKALEEEIISTANKCKSQVLAEKCYYRSPEMSKLMGENTPQRVTDPEDPPLSSLFSISSSTISRDLSSLVKAYMS